MAFASPASAVYVQRSKNDPSRTSSSVPAWAAAGARTRKASASTVAAAGPRALLRPAVPRPTAFDVVMVPAPEGGRYGSTVAPPAPGRRGGARSGRRVGPIRPARRSTRAWPCATTRRPAAAPRPGRLRAGHARHPPMPLDGYDLTVKTLGPCRRDSPLAELLYLRRSSHHWVDASDRVLLDDTAAMVRARGVRRRGAARVRARRAAAQDLLRPVQDPRRDRHLRRPVPRAQRRDPRARHGADPHYGVHRIVGLPQRLPGLHRRATAIPWSS